MWGLLGVRQHPSEPRDLCGLRKLERVLLPTQSSSFCPVEGLWIDRILARLGLRRSWLLELLPYMHGVLASEGPIIQNAAPGAVPAISNPKTRRESQCILSRLPLFLALSLLLRSHFCAFIVLEFFGMARLLASEQVIRTPAISSSSFPFLRCQALCVHWPSVVSRTLSKPGPSRSLKTAIACVSSSHKSSDSMERGLLGRDNGLELSTLVWARKTLSRK